MELEVLKITKTTVDIDFNKLWEIIKSDLGSMEDLDREEIIDEAATLFEDNCIKYLSDLLGVKFIESTNNISEREDPFHLAGGTQHNELRDIDENLEMENTNNLVFHLQLDDLVEKFKKYLEEG